MAEGGVPAVTKSLACQNCEEFLGKDGCRLRPKASQEAVSRGEILCGIKVPKGGTGTRIGADPGGDVAVPVA